MSDQENIDVGKVIGLIMENPQLIEQIANLAKGSGAASEAPQVEEEKTETLADVEASPTVSQPTYSQRSERSNRAHLLGALKPYVSSERAKAIDSMISIADILDMMRTR